MHTAMDDPKQFEAKLIEDDTPGTVVSIPAPGAPELAQEPDKEICASDPDKLFKAIKNMQDANGPTDPK